MSKVRMDDSGTNCDISRQELSEIPAEVRNSTTCKGMDASNNRLTTFQGLPRSLEVLVLSNNSIANLPMSLQNLRSLKWLDVSHNKLQSVIPINKLAALQYLFLQHNRISWVEELSVLHELLEVDVEGNQVQDVREAFSLTRCKSLRVLNLASNPVLQ